MVIFLYGVDSFRSRQYLHKLIEKFRVERDPGGYNLARINAAIEKEPGRILEQVRAIPFLAPKRMVVVESLLASSHKSLMAELGAFIEAGRLHENTILILWEEGESWKIKEAKALGALLLKEKYAQKFDALAGADLVAWIQTEVQGRGGSIEPAAASFLATASGGDSWVLHTVLEQLLAYTHEKGVIRLADAQVFLSTKEDDNIFTLVDTIVSGNMKQTYAMVQEQYRMGKDAHYIFAMMLRQYRILLTLRDLLERGNMPPPDVLAKQLSLHPFVIKKTLPLIRRHTLADLQEKYRRLLEWDIGIKHGAGDGEMLLDVLVGRLATTHS